MPQDLKDRTLAELENLVLEFGQKKYLAGYIFKFVHGQGITDISQISPLSKEFRRRLTEGGCYISPPGNVQTLEDPDGTIKYLFELQDAHRTEAVLLSDEGRKTVCISTQVGCAMNCAFCATGRLGLGRNLSAAEIVDQVGSIRRDKHRISSVVYMGMGEPLANYDAVVRSVRILNHPEGYNIGIRHLTISTCGIPSAIERLAGENIHPRLAISLNAPGNPLRTRLMPINKKYPIESILRAVKACQSKTRRRITFEYVLIKGVNDTAIHARMLAKLVAGVMCNINLIEFNPHPGCRFAGSDKKAIGRFADTLRAAGIETTVRYKKGRKIRAACGQLGADMRDKEV
jgi:23S rRNA (adenine2503-C2)-methyltransferase